MPTKNLDLCSLIERFNSEDRCHDYLEALRWPDGVRCPRCHSARISRITTRRKYECNTCRYQFSVLVDSVLQDTKLPLWKWFLATYMMIESKKGVSANQLKRMLGISYKTAWYLCHRIRAAMAVVNEHKLDGTVEIDETWIGGKLARREGRNQYANKVLVLGAIERDGEVRLKVEKRLTRKAMQDFIRAVVDGEDVEKVYTDEFAGYDGVALGVDTEHQTVNHGDYEWVRGDVHTNTIEGVWSLLKRSVIGTYHQLSAKHLPAYIDEFEWRFNNRDNDYLFRDTIRALVESENLEYKELTA